VPHAPDHDAEPHSPPEKLKAGIQDAIRGGGEGGGEGGMKLHPVAL